ncbi:MAG: translation initiation factor IF-6, partial [Thermoplasmata archaeon]
MIRQFDIRGNPYLGVMIAANDEIALVPKDIDKREEDAIEEALDVEVVKTSIGGCSIIGSLVCLNSSYALVADIATDEEISLISKYIHVERIDDRINACGNNILASDTCAYVNPDFPESTRKQIAKALGVEVIAGTIAGLKITGSAALATKKGILTHPKIRRNEMELLKKHFQLEVSI